MKLVPISCHLVPLVHIKLPLGLRLVFWQGKVKKLQTEIPTRKVSKQEQLQSLTVPQVGTRPTMAWIVASHALRDHIPITLALEFARCVQRAPMREALAKPFAVVCAPQESQLMVLKDSTASKRALVAKLANTPLVLAMISVWTVLQAHLLTMSVKPLAPLVK
jgi:hypothetical protein